jgi:CubicO group peptidase (beta-lactamase class C family)
MPNNYRAASIAALLVIASLLAGCEQAKLGYARLAGLPTDSNVLFWTVSERDKAFRQMEVLARSRTVATGPAPRALQRGDALPLALLPAVGAESVAQYLDNQNAAGVVVLHEGKIRLEAYNDFDEQGRWTSFSVAKSLTSTLVGAAIQDGLISSLDAALTDYIPELAGSGYEGVTVRQLLTMQSGVRWNEDYEDPQSDVALFNLTAPVDGLDPIVVYMRGLAREFDPGIHWRYNTGETNLIGVLVANATGKPLAQYLSEKVWAPYGMQGEAEWMLNEGGSEIGGCCISARLRDYALFGQFVLDGGQADGQQIVPTDWFRKAGSKQADINRAGKGYGYQWWTYDDGSFAARGIFGQGIFIDPARQLVIASNANWNSATNSEQSAQREAFYTSVQAAIDAQAE